MAFEVRTFQVTIPAGTAKTSLYVESLPMPPREVVRIDMMIPAGSRGVMGFQIGSSGQQIIPKAQGTFIIADNETIVWDFEGQIDSGAWELFGYNTGTYDHTVYIRFLVNPTTTTNNTTPNPIIPIL